MADYDDSVVLGDLRRMRTWFELAERWTQRAWARDALGYSVDWAGDDATCYCLVGYIKRHKVGAVARRRLRDAANCGAVELLDVNDSVDHAGLLRIIDDAIALVLASASQEDLG